ncbi:MAG: glycosyltransferase family 2 protein [Ferruginibacter sp.]
MATHKQKINPSLYISIFAIWIACLAWFHPRLVTLTHMGDSNFSRAALWYFVIFIELAWLYGIYNLMIVAFAWFYNRSYKPVEVSPLSDTPPSVDLLYTTCNDFSEESILSCVYQDYRNYRLYILDDSRDEAFITRIDEFASKHPGKVTVVRRKDNAGFKAGNLNYALKHICTSPYFAIADADEILPAHFLSKLVPILKADPSCGFVQANHHSNPNDKSELANALGVGIDIHWNWYQPLRNKFGFVMFLGHGALLRKSCWKEVGGFPEIVSEDLAFAIRIREKGYRGRFAKEVVCYEDFPTDIRAFRIRHMKWTRGNCEFLGKEGMRLIKSKYITLAEKLDILFPTLNLPLTLLYFLFMIDANIVFTVLYGQSHPITILGNNVPHLLPTVALNSRFAEVFTPDFFAITLVTFFSPILCFIIAMAKEPRRLYKFLSHSTTVYASLSTLSAIGVLSYLVTRKATFLVTGDKSAFSTTSEARPIPVPVVRSGFIFQLPPSIKRLLALSHPDQKLVQFIELFVGIGFAILCVILFQVSFFGLCLAFILLPLLHHIPWGKNRLIRFLVYLPFTIILAGLLLTSMNLLGLPSVFFGYGFHF